MICNAIIKYAEVNALSILTSSTSSIISIKSILNIYQDLHPKDEYASFLSEYLYSYFRSRQDLFAKDVKNGDVISIWDIEEDKDYLFSYAGITGLV